MIKVGSIVKLVKNEELDKYLRETNHLRAYNKELIISQCYPINHTEFPYCVKYNGYNIILRKDDCVEVRTNILLQQIYDNEIQNRR